MELFLEGGRFTEFCEKCDQWSVLLWVVFMFLLLLPVSAVYLNVLQEKL